MTQEPVSFTLWEALKAGSPALAVEGVGAAPPATLYAEFPGFRDWLLSEYALGWPSKRIRDHLNSIRDEQRDDSEQVWPALTKRDIDRYHVDWRGDWLPLRARLSQSIENVGVLAKNERLLSLERNARDIEEMMYDERNSKSNQLYLVSEYRALLRQIAEEKGELGENAGASDDALLKLAVTLAEAIKVQGTGIQQTGVDTSTFDYYPKDESEKTPVQRESASVSGDEVSSEPSTDALP